MSEPVLELRDVSVRYGRGRDTLTAVDSISLTVPRGGTLGVVGESGSGKSTLARMVVGLAALAEGQVLLAGDDCTDPDVRNSLTFRRRVQMVFQDPKTSLNPRMTIGKTLSEALSMRDVRRQDRRRKAVELLDLVGIPSAALVRYPHQFSGGQSQRIAIARALAVQPELILLDEITSALDVSIQATILNLLDEVQKEFRLSLLFISHDLAVIGAMSDVVAVMYMGQVVERGTPAELLSSPAHPYAQALIASIPSIQRDSLHSPLLGDIPDPRNPPAGCRFHTRCQIGPSHNPDRTICTSHDPQEIASQQPHNAACHFAVNPLSAHVTERARV